MQLIFAAPLAVLALVSEGPNLTPELREVITELAATAWLAGACERYLDPAEADRFMAAMRNPDGLPGQSGFDRFVGALSLESYAEGRIDLARHRVDASSCQRLIDRQDDLLKRAADALP